MTTKKCDFHDIDDPKQRAYVVEYAETANHTLAAKAADVSIRTAFNWRTDTRPQYQEFQEALQVARQQLADRVEAEVVRRAVEDGSNTMLIFLCKRLMPEYREGYRKPSVEEEAREAARRECFEDLKAYEISRIGEMARLQQLFTG